VLEDSPLVNAGCGSAFTADGTHEMEACIMDGGSRAAGAVLGLRTTRHPVQGARAVMDRSPQVAIYGCDAWLEQQGLEQRPTSWFDATQSCAQGKEARGEEEEGLREQEAKPGGKGVNVAARAKEAAPGEQETKQGGKGVEVEVVAAAQEEAAFSGSAAGRAAPGWAGGSAGAVVLDSEGHLVAASSCGGRDRKWTGAVGGAALPGAGTYSCPACAVSCSGTGEELLRHMAASTVCEMVTLGFPLARACDSVRRDRMGGGGMIAVDRFGDVVTSFTTGAVVYGVARDGEAATVARVAVSAGRPQAPQPSAPPPPAPPEHPPASDSGARGSNTSAQHPSASDSGPRGSNTSVTSSSGRDVSPWPPCLLS
jgi:beta-aspartyl-peptidase (threonine type)